MSVSYNVKELYSGVLNKCGARVKSWNRRWFVLKSDYCLYYYKDTAKGHLGAISLRDPKFKARKGSVSDIAWPKGAAIESTIAVVTSHRTYLMYGSGEQEADDWVRILNSTREKLLEEANSANRLLSGSRSYSATTVNNKASSSNGTSKSRGLSESVPPPLLEDGPELTYEAVYDSPEADLSQSGSSNGSPNLNTKQGERHTSTTDSIYDLASGEEGGGRHDDQHDDPVDTSQPLYAEAAEPDEQSGQEDEPSAVYDDVEMTHHTSTSHTPQRQANGSGGGGKDKPVEMYEPIDAESPHTPSAKHLPLPTIPMATRNASSANGGSQPIYEDIADTSGAQPLYEAVSVDDSAPLDKYIQEAERSDDEGSGSLPPLPPKDDLPPLPPKDNNAPQLPPKGDQSSPSLPPKTEVKVPPLPPKEDAPASSHNMNTATHVPPSLPVKDEGPEGSHQPPLASPRHVQPPSSPSPGQQASGGTSNLSPSGQRKPTPRERTITPPPMKKPSPVPRRRVSPTTAGQGSAAAVDGSPVTRRVSPTTGGQGNATANSPVLGHASDISRTPQPVNGVAVEETSSKARSTSSSTGRRISQESFPSESQQQPSPELPAERGMALFKQRQEQINQQTESDLKNREESIKTLTLVTSDPAVSPHHKGKFAEAMREIEHERLKASEERFRWERERMKLEEERRRFEEEKRKLQEEIESTKKQLQQQQLVDT